MTLCGKFQENEVLLLVPLFICELSLALMAAALYLQGERPFVEFLFSSKTGIMFGLAILAFAVSGRVIVCQYLSHKRSPSPHFRLVVLMNLITVLLIGIMCELVVRAGSHREGDREMFANVILKPRIWQWAQPYYRELAEKSVAGQALLVYDEDLGWTVGSNRHFPYSTHKKEGPYWSSEEGLRAPKEKFLYGYDADKTDIAIVGDSFTFGDEVEYEEVWGFMLDQLLGEKFRVLNFGVPGYGLDQIYLRYQADVRKWNPKVVIFGFIPHDLLRSTLVYPFASQTWRLPFSKPRFVLSDGQLTLMNRNAVPPEEIFSRRSISELPALEYDRGYRPSDWEKSWYHFSYLIRLFTSRYPPWFADNSEEELLQLNAEILKSFVRSATQAGSIPLIVYFPNRGDFDQPNSYLPLGKRMLQEAGLPYIDPTPCLLEVPPSVRFQRGGHYSPQSNVAVAKCLVDAVRELLGQPADG